MFDYFCFLENNAVEFLEFQRSLYKCDNIHLISPYSNALFNYLVARMPTQLEKRQSIDFEVSLDELKAILHCNEDTYSKFKQFDKEILRRCSREVSLKTCIDFNYIPLEKKGRKVKDVLVIAGEYHIAFTFSWLEVLEKYDLELTIEQIKVLHEKLVRLNVSLLPSEEGDYWYYDKRRNYMDFEVSRIKDTMEKTGVILDTEAQYNRLLEVLDRDLKVSDYIRNRFK